jgi:hypothetical protein
LPAHVLHFKKPDDRSAGIVRQRETVRDIRPAHEAAESGGGMLQFYPDEWLDEYRTSGWDMRFGFRIVSLAMRTVNAPSMLILQKIQGEGNVFRRVSVAFSARGCVILGESATVTII